MDCAWRADQHRKIKVLTVAFMRQITTVGVRRKSAARGFLGRRLFPNPINGG